MSHDYCVIKSSLKYSYGKRQPLIKSFTSKHDKVEGCFVRFTTPYFIYKKSAHTNRVGKHHLFSHVQESLSVFNHQNLEKPGVTIYRVLAYF